MKKIGITGGIGSGKTTVCKIFENLGIPVYYADKEAKRLMYQNKALKSAIKKLLGNQAYHRNGRLNRKFVANIVFSNKGKLNDLNSLVHPAVRADTDDWFALQTTPYALNEAALLVENGSYKDLDALIVVSAPEELRIQRVIARDQSKYEDVKARIKNQLPDKEKKKVADYVIDNSGEVSLINQVWKIHQELVDY